MVLHSPSTIDGLVTKGYWGDQALLDLLKVRVAGGPSRVSVIDTDRPGGVGWHSGD